MSLNRAQRGILTAGFLLIAGLAVNPPWTRTLRGFSEDGGYAPLWNPPSRADGWAVRVAWDRLSLSWVVIATLTAVLVLARQKRDGAQRQ